VSAVKLLALEHNPAKWWSPLTDAFCSYSGQHLARNLFFGYMFGRVVQNTESNSALWVSYLLSAAGEIKLLPGACADEANDICSHTALARQPPTHQLHSQQSTIIPVAVGRLLSFMRLK
jgi:hypothetical protein